MTWNKYLKHQVFISNRMGIKLETDKRWSSMNYVPAPRFDELQRVLASLGHQLTPIEMRELNEHKNT
jgi:hypothetical protein